MKIIAFYLPQFHEIPENDEWWGKGFTEWVNVKKAQPLFEGHSQPRVPLNGNYYNLLNDDVKIWQANLAKKYGIYGFCYYHYWFSGRMVLEKPMEQMLANPAVDIPFCICWANESWTKAWIGQNEVLLPQFYGDRQEWKEHYEYLAQFFKDPRYIKENGKPLVVIYRPNAVSCLSEMLDYWKELAQEDGFPGLCFAYQRKVFDDSGRFFDYDIEFQPGYAIYDKSTKGTFRENEIWKMLKNSARIVNEWVERRFGFDLRRYLESEKKAKAVDLEQYEEVWETILKSKPENEKSIPGAFVGWDNTPRKGIRGQAMAGEDPTKFEEYMVRQIRRAREVYHRDMIFLYAWNEWAEGGYMEPDERFGYGNLEAVRNALIKTGEFPW